MSNSDPTPNFIDLSALVGTIQVADWTILLYKQGSDCYARVEGPGFRIQGPTVDTMEKAEAWARDYAKGKE